MDMVEQRTEKLHESDQNKKDLEQEKSMIQLEKQRRAIDKHEAEKQEKT